MVVAKLSASNEAVHPEPVWRDRSDFIVGANLPEPGRSEQLWVRQTSDRQFEVCCIPFFLYGVALGDIIETDESYNMIKVIKGSGRAVFRAWFGESWFPREDVEKAVVALGALTEWSSVNLLAIDAADAGIADAVFRYLANHHDQGHLQVETGKAA